MTIQTFFERHAQALTDGDLETAADTLATPATIYVGSQQINVPDRASFLETMRGYLQNLAVESYARTSCEVTHVTDQHNGRQQAFVTWTNHNDQGAVISTFDAVYILCDAGEGRLQCATVEILPPIKQRLVAGLALA